MTAYIIASIDVTDPADYMTYASQTVALAEKWGGRFLVKGGGQTVLEGPVPARHVLIEFPDRATAEAWHASKEYQAILPIALRASNRTVLVVDGV